MRRFAIVSKGWKNAISSTPAPVAAPAWPRRNRSLKLRSDLGSGVVVADIANVSDLRTRASYEGTERERREELGANAVQSEER
ncbi:hypothetical protein ABL78_8590 [Leptomonas seymouri]|uniref:Uncharacterized protein n=1 Tax=Leptomonas seymouri TaxID=5684 RepID=A0A0N1IGX8_LEPSE|nr:hypothetical protein ABL78_8590 [Leptomonas seymouri]|eukprot:KPI82400.1 hypothetical protein ABL78_8590 [Leptomonas seymouri]